LIVRPLLDTTRRELRDYLSERRIAFREDASNLDVSIARNRVRHELLALLKERFSPGIVDTLARDAEIAREDAEYFDSIVAAEEGRVIHRTVDGLTIDLPALASYPEALARRLVRRAMELVAPERFVGFDAVESVLDLADKTSEMGRQIDVPGQRAERCGDAIVLREGEGAGSTAIPSGRSHSAMPCRSPEKCRSRRRSVGFPQSWVPTPGGGTGRPSRPTRPSWPPPRWPHPSPSGVGRRGTHFDPSASGGERNCRISS
jgi:hypothetical protein